MGSATYIDLPFWEKNTSAAKILEKPNLSLNNKETK